MAFKKLEKSTLPPRQWAIFGDAGSGKSTFAAQMAGPLLVIDADHRFQEMAHIAQGDVYTLDTAGNDAESIAKELRTNMPGSGVRTIIVDSLTAIIAPLVSAAVMGNDAGQNKNKVAAYKPKAMAMRLLQDSITSWGTHVLWIYHTRQGRDEQARQVTSTSISAVELARLRRSLNMTLRVVAEGNQRGIVVDWARRGRSGITLWDDTGCWRNMPERIESAVYDGLSQDEQDALEKATPTSFSGPNAAIAWGFERGCFRDAVHAANAYEEVKRTQQPATAAAMWAHWINEVAERCNAPADMPPADEGEPEPADFNALPASPRRKETEHGSGQTLKDFDALWEPTEKDAPRIKAKTISMAQLTRANLLAVDVYGPEWESQEKPLAQWASQNVATRFRDLLPEEGAVLVAHLEKQKRAHASTRTPVTNGAVAA